MSDFFGQAENLNERIQNERSTTDRRRRKVERRIKEMMPNAFWMDEFIGLRFESEEILEPKDAKAFAVDKRHAQKES